MALYERVSIVVNGLYKREGVSNDESSTCTETSLKMDCETPQFQYFGSMVAGFAAYKKPLDDEMVAPRCIGGTVTIEGVEEKHLAVLFIGVTNEMVSVPLSDLESGKQGKLWNLKMTPFTDIKEWESDEAILTLLTEKYDKVDDDVKAIKWLCGPYLRRLQEQEATHPNANQ